MPSPFTKNGDHFDSDWIFLCGFVAQAHGISVDEAFTRIRTYARGNNKKHTDLAHSIVTDQSTVPDLS